MLTDDEATPAIVAAEAMAVDAPTAAILRELGPAVVPGCHWHGRELVGAALLGWHMGLEEAKERARC